MSAADRYEASQEVGVGKWPPIAGGRKGFAASKVSWGGGKSAQLAA